MGRRSQRLAVAEELSILGTEHEQRFERDLVIASRASRRDDPLERRPGLLRPGAQHLCIRAGLQHPQLAVLHPIEVTAQLLGLAGEQIMNEDDRLPPRGRLGLIEYLPRRLVELAGPRQLAHHQLLADPGVVARVEFPRAPGEVKRCRGHARPPEADAQMGRRIAVVGVESGRECEVGQGGPRPELPAGG